MGLTPTGLNLRYHWGGGGAPSGWYQTISIEIPTNLNFYCLRAI